MVGQSAECADFADFADRADFAECADFYPRCGCKECIDAKAFRLKHSGGLQTGTTQSPL